MIEIKEGPGGQAEAHPVTATTFSVPGQAPKADTEDDLLDFFNALFRDGEGTVCICVASGQYEKGSGRYGHRGWDEVFKQWPSEFDEVRHLVMAKSEFSDVYLCPYLLADGRREKGSSVARPLVHAEIDCQVDPEVVRNLGGFAIASGSPGHAHVYIPLTESIGAAEHETLCRALGSYLGAKDIKVSDNDVFRLPGTRNFKPTVLKGGGSPPATVRWLVRPSGGRMEAGALAAMLAASPQGDNLTAAVPEGIDDAASRTPVRDLVVRFPTVHAALHAETNDRSADTMRIVRACKSNGLSLRETRWVVDQRGDLKLRLAGRSDDDVARCYERAESTSEPGDVAAAHAGQQRLEDAHISEYIADRLRGEFVHSASLGWLRWDEKRWKSSVETAVVERVRTELIDFHHDQAKAGAEPDWLRKLSGLLSASKIRSITYLTKAILATEDTFDAHPDLLNVSNGVVDLRSGKLRPHDPNLLLTKITPGEYVPTATHSDWTSALRALPPNAAQWLQVRLGQAITGHPVSDDRLVVLRGSGANGKTTVIDSVRAALGGDFAVAMPERVLLARTGDHPTEMMTMRGARLALMEEFPELSHLNVKRLKDLLGTGELTARYIRQDSVSWKPSHSPMVTTNYLPRVDESDDGTWRRLALLEFPYRYRRTEVELKTDSDRLGDPNLRERLRSSTTGQREAVLAWLIQGAVRWYLNNRQMPADPPEVVGATQRWRQSSDLLLRYLDERVVFDPSYHVATTDLFGDFSEWVERNGHKAWSDQSFSARLANHTEVLANGVDKKRIRESAKSTWSPPPHRWPDGTDGGTGRPRGQYMAWTGVRFRNADDEDESRGDQE